MKIQKSIHLLLLILGINMIGNAPDTTSSVQKALFAGGCFWCMEPSFQALDGITSVLSGYTGGTGENPTYQDYAQKGYIEAIQITYDPQKISYDTLLNVFWRQVDPTDSGGQFVDRGPQYRSAIFYYTDEQKEIAEQSKQKLAHSKRFNKPIATEILPATKFYKAEEYHQDYAEKNPIRYKFYRYRSGRDNFLEKTWNKPIVQKNDSTEFIKPSDAELRKKLTSLQYKVTQQKGTEPAHDNAYSDNYKPGIYVDIISGEPLFSSLDKYDSKTGWPSFTKPLEPKNIIEKKDNTLFTSRTEVRSKNANSHLGHVFKDGPPPTGLRYCLNSAALKFIPADQLEKEGYGKYKKLFE